MPKIDKLRQLLEKSEKTTFLLIKDLDLDVDRALDLAQDLAQDLHMALDLVRALDLDLARALDLDLARDLELALHIVWDLDQDLDLILARPLALEIAKVLARARARARALDLNLAFLPEDKHYATDSQAEGLEITVEVSEDISPDKLREIVRQTALAADTVHRSHGGQGLQIDRVDIFEGRQVPEGSK